MYSYYKEQLLCSGHLKNLKQGVIWSDRTILYPDYSGGYTDLCMC